MKCMNCGEDWRWCGCNTSSPEEIIQDPSQEPGEAPLVPEVPETHDPYARRIVAIGLALRASEAMVWQENRGIPPESLLKLSKDFLDLIETGNTFPERTVTQ
jgi:hypothetical protein